MSDQNRARKLKPPRVKVQKCRWCVQNGGGYNKRTHPRQQDCAGTGNATNWK